MYNRDLNGYKKILVMIIFFLCFSCGTSDEDNDWKDCETFMRPNSIYQLKVINNSSSYIYVSLNQYNVDSIVDPGVCETYGLDIGYKLIEISQCEDDICENYSFTIRETLLFEEGDFHKIKVTDSYFIN